MSHLDFRVFKSIRNSKKHEVCQVPVESPYLWPIAVHLDVISISFGHRDVPRGRTVHGGCEAVHAFARAGPGRIGAGSDAERRPRQAKQSFSAGAGSWEKVLKATHLGFMARGVVRMRALNLVSPFL